MRPITSIFCIFALDRSVRRRNELPVVGCKDRIGTEVLIANGLSFLQPNHPSSTARPWLVSLLRGATFYNMGTNKQSNNQRKSPGCSAWKGITLDGLVVFLEFQAWIVGGQAAKDKDSELENSCDDGNDSEFSTIELVVGVERDIWGFRSSISYDDNLWLWWVT
ncbi:hypothetical protein HG530_008493 [Fusarium avenaceum]|nr:hypothetical protein HG530_008493 [Fusarium avenaceum]